MDSKKFLEITEKTALAAYPWIGRGEEKKADQAAVDCMRSALNKLPISGRIVIGEGERDKAPLLARGERVGLGVEEWDLALDPLECTTNCATLAGPSFSALAAGPKGTLLEAPDLYMMKMATSLPGVIALGKPLSENLQRLAEAKGKKISHLIVGLLNRERHKAIIAELMDLGVKIKLFSDGDIATSLMTFRDLDLYYGIGGAPEGVIAAAALSILGGDFQGQLLYNNQTDRDKTSTSLTGDLDRIFTTKDLVGTGELAFALTGVTGGDLLSGVEETADYWWTDSIFYYRSPEGKISLAKNLQSHEKK
jgi:fructose-1,6-bisphosphatase class II